MKALALCLFATPAFAAPPVCMDRADLIANLDRDFSERHIVRGLEARGPMMEIYVSPSGSWTMVIVSPNKTPLQACFVASGTGFMMIAQGEPS